LSWFWVDVADDSFTILQPSNMLLGPYSNAATYFPLQFSAEKKRMYQTSRHLPDVQESLYIPYKFSNCNWRSISGKIGGGSETWRFNSIPEHPWWKPWYWMVPFEMQKRNEELKLFLITRRVKVCITLFKLIENNYLHHKIM
jgi:hypothetical protein